MACFRCHRDSEVKLGGLKRLDHAAAKRLSDDLVGGCEQRWRHCEAERRGGLEVDDK